MAKMYKTSPALNSNLLINRRNSFTNFPKQVPKYSISVKKGKRYLEYMSQYIKIPDQVPVMKKESTLSRISTLSNSTRTRTLSNSSLLSKSQQSIIKYNNYLCNMKNKK